MAGTKTKSAAKRTTKSASRKSSRSSASAGPKQTAATAGDNEPGASLVNERASEKTNARGAETAGHTAEDVQVLTPDVLKVINDPDEPLHSLNSLPKDQGGLPHDELVHLRSLRDQVVGAQALGQPGQKGHGVGTASATIQGPLSEEDAKKDDAAYRARFKS